MVAQTNPIPINPENIAVLDHIRQDVVGELSAFLNQQGRYLEKISTELEPVNAALKDFLLQGGKRLRPLFAYIGYLGAGGSDNKSALKAAASLELLQACALIHDDLMDGSDTRRNQPAIHKRFEAIHSRRNLRGSAVQFGLSSAVLLGDLALIWSDVMLNQSFLGDDVHRKVFAVHDEMRIELMAGQYLDVFEQTQNSKSVERSLMIARYKSGKYSIERPLHFGAAMAHHEGEISSVYSEYGLPLGEAFQLRDDLLGVFGDPHETGKPAGDDLREGKRTVLIALASERSTAADGAQLDELLGKTNISAEEIANLQTIIEKTGAVAEVERMISERTERALAALNSSLISDRGRALLHDLALLATQRTK